MSQDESDDYIENCLALADEPHNTIIRRRLEEGLFGSTLNEMQARYGLTEEQIDTVTLIVFRTACDPELIDAAKDALIADAGVSYEVAVRIQRDMVRDVIMPIKEEGDAVQRRESVSLQQSAGDALFSDYKAKVTKRVITIGGATYPVSTLARYVGPFLVPHLGFIGDLLKWGHWYVAVHFIGGEERDIYWSSQDDAVRFAKALHAVMV